MKKITNSFIKNIVRQSLNESYGLLNEDLQEVEPYSIKTSVKHGTVPKGTSVYNMTYEKCPEGGICFEFLDQAKEDSKNLSGKDLINRWCDRTHMATAMGKPTKSGTVLTNVTTPLFAQLTDFGMNHGIITTKLKDLADFPTFCVANKKFKTYGGGDYGLGIAGTSETTGSDYGIENDDEAERAEDYAITDGLFENSIAVSDEFYETWKKQLEEKYKATLDAAQKKIDDEAQKKIDDAAKKAEDAANLAKIGGAGLEGFMINHPTLIASSVKELSGVGWNARVYLLDTGNPTIDKFYYGEMVKDGVPLAVKFRKDVTTEPLTLDPDTDWRLKYGTSQSDTWKYNDVIVSADGQDIALTTDPKGEEKFEALQTESYRHKGFRHNLLTEIELKYDKTKPQTGAEVGNIQKKLGLPAEKNPTFGPITLEKVINHQTEKKLKRTDGVVDDETYASIMALEDPAFELSIAKKSKGDDVKLIQQKLSLKPNGGFGTDTEIAVKAFQETNKDLLPDTIKLGVVDQATFDLIKRYKGPNSRKVFSGAKTNYVANDWIIITPNKGVEGNIFIDQKYYKIKSVTPDRMTVVLDLPIGVPGLSAEDYKTLKVGGMTAKVLFGTEAEGLTKNAPVASNDNDSGSSGDGQSNSGTGKRQDVSGNKGTGTTVDPEKQRKRDIRKKETCNTLREIKQYLNNTKGLSMTVNCKWNQEIRNQVMVALTGGTPEPTQDTGVNVQSVPVTDTLF